LAITALSALTRSVLSVATLGLIPARVVGSAFEPPWPAESGAVSAPVASVLSMAPASRATPIRWVRTDDVRCVHGAFPA
jgi:hypothetical protein